MRVPSPSMSSAFGFAAGRERSEPARLAQGRGRRDELCEKEAANQQATIAHGRVERPCVLVEQEAGEPAHERGSDPGESPPSGPSSSLESESRIRVSDSTLRMR